MIPINKTVVDVSGHGYTKTFSEEEVTEIKRKRKEMRKRLYARDS